MNDLSVKEAMEMLHVSETTIRRLIKRGDLPNAYLQDQKRWIPQRDIDAYLQRQQPALAPETPPISEPDMPPPEASPDKKVTAKPQPVSVSPASATKQTPVEEKVGEQEPSSSTQTPGRPGSRPADEGRTMIPIIAQPIEELEPSPVPAAETQSAPPTQQAPVPYQSGAIQPTRAHEQSFKWILVQTGIISTNWLEKVFKQIRTALERYKAKAFPETSEPKDKHS